MTVIAGVVAKDGTVYMGADRQASNRYTRQARRDPKIFRVKDSRDDGELVIGVSGSCRESQVLRFGFTPEWRKQEQDAYEWMVTEVAEKMRKRAKDTGILKTSDSLETHESHVLVAYAGRLFTIQSDFHVAEVDDDYASVGSGSECALGALFAMRKERLVDPVAAVTVAVEAASYHTPWCGFGVQVEVLNPPKEVHV